MIIWRKSSYSTNNGACVEAAWAKSSYSSTNNACAPAPGMVAVRDSKDPDGPALAFTRSEWEEFISALKS